MLVIHTDMFPRNIGVPERQWSSTQTNASQTLVFHTDMAFHRNIRIPERHLRSTQTWVLHTGKRSLQTWAFHTDWRSHTHGKLITITAC
jgi:hypothetical protein